MSYVYGTPPKPWQVRGFNASYDKLTYAYLMDPGMGKTKLTLDVAAYNYREGVIDTLVVVAPSGVHRVWPSEAYRHLPHVPYDAAAYRAGSVNNDLKRVLASSGRLKIVSVNIEALSHPSGHRLMDEVFKGRQVMLVVDESQKIRTPSAKRTRYLWKLGQRAVLRRILTGTAVIRGLENLYAQYRFLHEGIIGCRTYTEFKANYCIEMGEFHTIVGYRNQNELLQRIARRTFFAYEQEMGLADQVVTRRPVELSAEQRRVYNDLKTHFLAELASGALVEGELAITRLTKLQQIVAGHARRDDGTWEPLPNGRVDAAVDVVQNAPSKILVWGQWQPDILQLSDGLRKAKVPHVTYFGANTPSQNAKNLEAFKSNPDMHAFVATQAAGGAGLTINEAKRTLNYSHTFNTEYVWQARKRNHRLGQDTVIHVTNLVTPGTTDSKILASNDRKEDVAALLRNPAAFAKWLDSEDE